MREREREREKKENVYVYFFLIRGKGRTNHSNSLDNLADHLYAFWMVRKRNGKENSSSIKVIVVTNKSKSRETTIYHRETLSSNLLTYSCISIVYKKRGHVVLMTYENAIQPKTKLSIDQREKK
jgi:hypothetical protein